MVQPNLRYPEEVNPYTHERTEAKIGERVLTQIQLPNEGLGEMLASPDSLSGSELRESLRDAISNVVWLNPDSQIMVMPEEPKILPKRNSDQWAQSVPEESEACLEYLEHVEITTLIEQCTPEELESIFLRLVTHDFEWPNAPYAQQWNTDRETAYSRRRNSNSYGRIHSSDGRIVAAKIYDSTTLQLRSEQINLFQRIQHIIERLFNDEIGALTHTIDRIRKELAALLTEKTGRVVEVTEQQPIHQHTRFARIKGRTSTGIKIKRRVGGATTPPEIIDHPNVLAEEGLGASMIAPVMEGTTLLDAEHALPTRIKCLADSMLGAHAIHKRGHGHNDVRSDNIFVVGEGREAQGMLFDNESMRFIVVKSICYTPEDWHTALITGLPLGAKGTFEEPGPPRDCFAFGATLLEQYCGHLELYTAIRAVSGLESIQSIDKHVAQGLLDENLESLCIRHRGDLKLIDRERGTRINVDYLMGKLRLSAVERAIGKDEEDVVPSLTQLMIVKLARADELRNLLQEFCEQDEYLFLAEFLEVHKDRLVADVEADDMIAKLIDLLQIYERREFNPDLYEQQCHAVDAWLAEGKIEEFCKADVGGLHPNDITDPEKAELLRSQSDAMHSNKIELTVLDPVKLVAFLQSFKEQTQYDTLRGYITANIPGLKNSTPPSKHIKEPLHPLGKDIKGYGFHYVLGYAIKKPLEEILERHKFTGMHTPAPEGKFRQFMRKKGVPRPIQYLIHRMLSPNPEDRVGMIEVVEQLGEEYGFHITTNEEGKQVTIWN